MRESGILMPVSSLPGPYGIGCFGKEAFKFVDFLADAGQKIWQLLPLSPTGYGDSPYQSCSAFAGNPYFIDLDALEQRGLLTDIGTEELGHLEMVGTIVHQLTRNLTEEQIKEAGFEAYFVDHTTGVFPQFASGYPWSASTMQVTGDTIADLTEDLAAEQKARVTYDNILRLSDDPDVSDVIKFLRAREIVHFQRFGEGLRLAKDRLDEKNVYYVNPSFDK